MASTITHIALSNYASQHMKPLPGAPFSRTLVQASDPKMELASNTLFDEIVNHIRPEMLDASEYTKNGQFDCDDFAFAFKGLVTNWYRTNRPNFLPMAIGIGWGKYAKFGDGEYHALNWVFIEDDQRLYWVEPQFIHSKPLKDSMAQFSKTQDRVNLMIV